MGITLGDLRNNRRTVPVTFDGMTFNVEYRPGALTPTFGEEERGKEWLIKVLLKLLADWEVYEDDAETVRAPITEGLLSSEAFGVPLLRAIYDAVTDDAFLPKARATTLQSG